MLSANGLIQRKTNIMTMDLRTTASSWDVAASAYEKFSEDFADALYHCVQRLNPSQGETLLDVATGTGWTARLAAARGANVTGSDFSDGQIAAAREVAERHGSKITFEVGDVHCLPYPDGSFDAVMSTFGVIFAGQPEIAANELARVCRPGGRLALVVWAVDSTIAALANEVFVKFSPLQPDPAPPSPFAWGCEARMMQLLEKNFELKFEHACTMLRAPDGESVWRLWNESHGLTITRMKALSAQAQVEFRDAFVKFHERYRTDVGIAMPRDYIIAIGVRP